MKSVAITLIFLIIATYSCKKYDSDRPLIHLQSPEKRLTNNWLLSGIVNFKTKKGGMGASSTQVLTFYRDGQVSGSMSFIYGSGSTVYGIVYSGQWDLIEKKEKLLITDKSGLQDTYEIQQLDRNRMILKNDSMTFDFTETDPH